MNFRLERKRSLGRQINKRILLKWFLKMGFWLTGFMWFRIGAGSCKICNQLLASMKDWKYLGHLVDC
jgi:hypothetical protein